jgi:hypothetical protein
MALDVVLYRLNSYVFFLFLLSLLRLFWMVVVKNMLFRLSQNELNSTIGINSTKTAAQNGSELFLGINNKIYMPL